MQQRGGECSSQHLLRNPIPASAVKKHGIREATARNCDSQGLTQAFGLYTILSEQSLMSCTNHTSGTILNSEHCPATDSLRPESLRGQERMHANGIYRDFRIPPALFGQYTNDDYMHALALDHDMRYAITVSHLLRRSELFDDIAVQSCWNHTTVLVCNQVTVLSHFRD